MNILEGAWAKSEEGSLGREKKQQQQSDKITL